MTPIVLIGASVRAAAWSCRRAGLEPFGIDLFNDTDLKAIAECVRIPFEDYPYGFLDCLKDTPSAPLIFTGALENHPVLLDELAKDRQVLGVTGQALRQIRDPFAVERALRWAGLPCIDCVDIPSASGDWLWKPLRGGGGDGITEYSRATPHQPDGYYQRFQEGAPHSAIFVADANRVELLGVTRQLIGERWLDAPPFRYAGNIGPVDVPGTTAAILRRIGATFGIGLLGLFGVDFLLEGDIPYVCEVNPRYTAAVEVLERAMGESFLYRHLRAFGIDLEEPKFEPLGICGKAIRYASKPLRFPTGIDTTDLADIPAPGEHIEAGWPVCTILAHGKTGEEVLARLRKRAAELKFSLSSAG